MTNEEARAALRKLGKIIAPLTGAEVDDPEEILQRVNEDAERFVAALATAVDREWS